MEKLFIHDNLNSPLVTNADTKTTDTNKIGYVNIEIVLSHELTLLIDREFWFLLF